MRKILCLISAFSDDGGDVNGGSGNVSGGVSGSGGGISSGYGGIVVIMLLVLVVV